MSTNVASGGSNGAATGVALERVMVCWAEIYKAARRKRKAFPITDTELNVIAALAIIGLSSNPNTGYNTPAATGTPSTL